MFKCKAGFAGFGEVNTPKEIVYEKCNEAKEKLKKVGISLVDTPPISDDEEGKDAKRAIKDLKKEEFDFLVLCITGWIPSYCVIKVISNFKDKPILLWGLTGKQIDDRFVTTAAQAGTTALRGPMEEMGYRFKYIYDIPNRKSKTKEIEEFAKAAVAVKKLSQSKMGQMGYRDMKLYGTMFDGTMLRGKIGVEVEFFEMLEIVQNMETIKEENINEIVNKIEKEWEFVKKPKKETLNLGAKIYIALKQKIEKEGYDGVSLIDVDGMKKLLKYPPSMVFMLLANELKVCTIPENDTLGGITQLICKYATGQISAYMEFYEFLEEAVLIGVPDYVPSEIVDGKNKVRAASFGNLSEGILNVSEVKTGEITMCRLGKKDNKYQMHIVSGIAKKPMKWEEAGWEKPAPQLPSLEVVLNTEVEEFVQKIMGQHYIITYGDNKEILYNVCNLLNIKIL